MVGKQRHSMVKFWFKIFFFDAFGLFFSFKLEYVNDQMGSWRQSLFAYVAAFHTFTQNKQNKCFIYEWTNSISFFHKRVCLTHLDTSLTTMTDFCKSGYSAKKCGIFDKQILNQETNVESFELQVNWNTINRIQNKTSNIGQKCSWAKKQNANARPFKKYREDRISTWMIHREPTYQFEQLK